MLLMRGKRFALNAYIALLNMNPIKIVYLFCIQRPLRNLFVSWTNPPLTLSHTSAHWLTHWSSLSFPVITWEGAPKSKTLQLEFNNHRLCLASGRRGWLGNLDLETGKAKPLFLPLCPSVSWAGQFPGSRKPLSGISAGGNRCGQETGACSTSWLLSQREDIPHRGGCKGGGGGGGNISNVASCVIAPKPQGGSERKRQGWWSEITWGLWSSAVLSASTQASGFI